MVIRLGLYFQWMPILLARNHFVGLVALLSAIVITGCSTVKEFDPLQAVAVVYSEVITTGMLMELPPEHMLNKKTFEQSLKKRGRLDEELRAEKFRFQFLRCLQKEINKSNITDEDQRAVAEKILRMRPGGITTGRIPPNILEMADSAIASWKYYKELYATYGGRVSKNWLPIDALLQHIETMETRGKIIFIDKKYKKSLFKYYRTLPDDKFVSEIEANVYFDVPWWRKESTVIENSNRSATPSRQITPRVSP